jgi:multidrug efflux pump subunit AcrB
MNLGVASVQNNRVVFFLMLVILLGGIWSYQNIGRLEDPEFTIKEALIITPYPGASAAEVSNEITNPIESACQQLGQLKRVESESTRGRSVVSAIIQDRYHRDSIPQVWNELRHKIADAQSRLPPSARGRSVVIDDFGDVYGIFLAISGEGFSYPELRRYSEFLRRELQTVKDVKKVDLFRRATGDGLSRNLAAAPRPAWNQRRSNLQPAPGEEHRCRRRTCAGRPRVSCA